MFPLQNTDEVFFNLLHKHSCSLTDDTCGDEGSAWGCGSPSMVTPPADAGNLPNNSEELQRKPIAAGSQSFTGQIRVTLQTDAPNSPADRKSLSGWKCH